MDIPRKDLINEIDSVSMYVYWQSVNVREKKFCHSQDWCCKYKDKKYVLSPEGAMSAYRSYDIWFTINQWFRMSSYKHIIGILIEIIYTFATNFLFQ